MACLMYARFHVMSEPVKSLQNSSAVVLLTLAHAQVLPSCVDLQ